MASAIFGLPVLRFSPPSGRPCHEDRISERIADTGPHSLRCIGSRTGLRPIQWVVAARLVSAQTRVRIQIPPEQLAGDLVLGIKAREVSFGL
jgi:hypothetical protein